MTFVFGIPTAQGSLPFEIKNGSTIVLLGANGSGKTRLGVYIENIVSSKRDVHRVAAHRSLTLNPNVQPPSLDAALKKLKFGYELGDHNHKHGNRWQGKPETALLNDFDLVLAALYAEENNASVLFRQACLKSDKPIMPPKTKLDILKEIWSSVLPHRVLVTSDSTIKTKSLADGSLEYSGSEMSDGERVIFYLIAQSLITSESSILIIDEPELHINKAILSQLWDQIEAARPDCAFIYITHDIEFSASRHAATKYVIRSFNRTANGDRWDIEIVPDNTNLPEDVVSLILGSRQPMLFVEGNKGSCRCFAIQKSLF